MSRLLGAAAVSGLVLITACVPLFALGLNRWGSSLLAAGLLGVAAYLVAGLRFTQRDLKTLAGNLERSRRQQLADDRPRGSDAQAASLDGMRDEIRALATDVAARRDRAALRAWHVLGDRRREGVACLMVEGDDVTAILAGDRTGANFEVLDPVASFPATPAHAMGALLIDLDRFAIGRADRDQDAWTGFARWLRSDVPVLGFSRVPERLSLGAAAGAQATAGALLPVVETADTVRFDRGIEPATEPATDRATEDRP
ncbi:hypothetical protein [Citricoccus sp.]|uniref:hypothetical protein n=1 Tax=Citricoccus sp. TaxID=1978372 RepID=UPI0028BE2454|nr:hypothetical protein [Citricoccus sp.]